MMKLFWRLQAAIKPKAIKEEQPIPHLVGAVSGYNIVLFAGAHYAAPQSLGALDLSQLDLASRPPEILIGRSYDEVVLAISAVIKQEVIQEQPTST
ncbi:MAG: hypothetical protein Q8L15_18180 [Methylobacter sp.]|nr:hypothetical protein [Methylobacter sp.]